MPRLQSYEYNHPSYHPPQNPYAPVPSNLRSAYTTPASQSVSVVVRNPPRAPTDNTSESSEETTRATNTSADDSREEEILRRALYYAPMTVGMAQGSDGGNGSVLMSGSTSRGTKRTHNDDELDSDISKQHRRLTTKEEVALFEICNQHADTFGNRSSLCKWWASIAAEFTRTHEGRTYSWHSVRRKVEMVTRQRIKYLEDQQQRGSNATRSTAEELMNPQWLAAVDAWIPTWQRWEEAENRRIAKRDELKNRRQPRPERKTTTKKGEQDKWRVTPGSNATSPADVNTAMAGLLHQVGTNNGGDTAASSSPTPSPSLTGPASSSAHFRERLSTPVTRLKLPPGFENMFGTPQVPQAPPIPSVSTPSLPQSDGRIASAVLETLGKLNKHLDAASSNGESVSSPALSALVQATSAISALVSPQKPQNQSQPQLQPQQDRNLTQAQIERVKKELRQEMQDKFRQELEKERASMEEKLDSLQRTQDLILEMLRQEPA
ncbi:hypothetical protein N7461_000987 [Penicillium sp. DV-2018c]|nr:hypothetical protein N7461_000987 [Penicillium sp. DV-2018c]